MRLARIFGETKPFFVPPYAGTPTPLTQADAIAVLAVGPFCHRCGCSHDEIEETELDDGRGWRRQRRRVGTEVCPWLVRTVAELRARRFGIGAGKTDSSFLGSRIHLSRPLATWESVGEIAERLAQKHGFANLAEPSLEEMMNCTCKDGGHTICPVHTPPETSK